MAHHWVFNSPNGTYSEGVCIYCGATQKALNCMPQDVNIKGLARNVNMRTFKTGDYYLQGGDIQGKTSSLYEEFVYVDRE